MDNVYNDVLRICDTTVGDALATKMLNKQAGFATNSHYWAMKSAGGTVYYYPTTAHRHDTHTLEHDAVTSDGGAFAFTTSGTWTLTIAAAEMLTVGASAVIINEGSADVDFRVESNGNANMLYVDGGNDAVGIGVTPNASNGLEVAGAVRIGDAGAATALLEVNVNQNAITNIKVDNQNAGNAAYSGFSLASSSCWGGLYAYNTAFAAATEYQDKVVLLAGSSTTALVLASEAAAGEVQVYVGGNAAGNKIATFTTTGLGINIVPHASWNMDSIIDFNADSVGRGAIYNDGSGGGASGIFGMCRNAYNDGTNWRIKSSYLGNARANLIEMDATKTRLCTSANTGGTGTIISWIERINLELTETVINQGGADLGFRVESNGNAHMLYVDGGNDAVGIGVVPNASNGLEVAGKVRIGDAGAAGVDLGVRVDQDATTVIEVRNENNHASARAICASASNVASGYFGSFPTLANTAEFRDKTVAYSTKILALCGVDDEVQVYAGGTAAVNKIATFTTDGLGIGRVPAYGGLLALNTPTDTLNFIDCTETGGTLQNEQGYITLRSGTVLRYIQTYSDLPA